jgi:hypothetical protein
MKKNRWIDPGFTNMEWRPAHPGRFPTRLVMNPGRLVKPATSLEINSRRLAEPVTRLGMNSRRQGRCPTTLVMNSIPLVEPATRLGMNSRYPGQDFFKQKEVFLSLRFSNTTKRGNYLGFPREHNHG